MLVRLLYMLMYSLLRKVDSIAPETNSLSTYSVEYQSTSLRL